ncbi:MAG TPA: tRNA pseudouridine(38-40) synthase TruA [Thermodesulfovibrionales bacterium]|nr:tRNA pseudouridine(38-40) synthase TruA [Thermodesulfovibrionales bacterium]
MRKIKLILEYDGSGYHGWQIQDEGLTIQGILEDRIQRLTGEPIRILGAGRTDAGVHALGQVATFRTESPHSISIIRKALDATLPQDIRIVDAAEADESFNPRDDALRKSYFYVLTNGRKAPVFLHSYAWNIPQRLDLPAMSEASGSLLGTHDFTSFMGSGSGIKNAVREVLALNIDRLDRIDFMTASIRGDFIRIGIEARGFLRHMVRNIVGTLVEVGRKRLTPEAVKHILDSKDRRLAGQTAPACGLFLERIDYGRTAVQGQ